MRKLPPWCLGLCSPVFYAALHPCAAATLNAVSRSDLCVTEGSLEAAPDRKLSVKVPKLRAEDACNLVYVMWRIEPQSRLVVSVKRNPGQHARR